MTNLYLKLLALSMIPCMFSQCKADKETKKPGKADRHFLQILVRDEAARPKDSLRLFMANIFYRVQENASYFDAVMGTDGLYHFKIPLDKTSGYLTIGRIIKGKDSGILSGAKTQELLPMYFWEAGDSVKVIIYKKENVPPGDLSPYDNYRYRFSGIGARKYRLRYSVDSTLVNTPNGAYPAFDTAFHYHDPYAKSLDAATNILEQHQADISRESYEILMADIFSYGSMAKFAAIREDYKRLVKSGGAESIQNFRSAYKSQLQRDTLRAKVSVTATVKSKDYATYILRKLISSFYINHGYDNADSVYGIIKEKYQARLRDHLLVLFFLDTHPENMDALFNDALSIVKTQDCLLELNQLKIRLPGLAAYNFALADTSGKIVRLSDFKGKVVLMDFWFTGCGGCAAFYNNTLSKVEKYFKDDNKVAFVSVSIDSNKDYWLNGIHSGMFTSEKISNLYTAGEKITAPIIKYYSVQEYPTVLLVDGKGRIFKFNSSDLYNPKSLIMSINHAKKLTKIQEGD